MIFTVFPINYHYKLSTNSAKWDSRPVSQVVRRQSAKLLYMSAILIPASKLVISYRKSMDYKLNTNNYPALAGFAAVVELAYTKDLKSFESNLVWVQVPPAALETKNRQFYWAVFCFKY